MKPADRTYRIQLEVPSAETENAAFLLFELGCTACAEEEGSAPGHTIIKANFPRSGQSRSGLKAAVQGALESFPPLRGCRVEAAAEAPADWEKAFRQNFAPFRIAQDLTIVPSWETGRHRLRGEIIELDPGMAFGTGLHETTRLCAEAIAALAARSGSLLDIGTGSGILAIAARKLGIGRICAVENDPVAIEVAQKNFERNGCGDIRLSPSLDDAAGTFDLVAANILLAPLVEMSERIVRRLAPGGSLVLSGITGDQEADLDAAYGALLKLRSTARRGEWSAMIYGGR